MPLQMARDGQQSSHLMQLPAELRLKILRYLLKSPEPLPSRLGLRYELLAIGGGFASYEVEEPFEESTLLSAQLLRTCQSLHTEGSHVLYNENTLVVTCCNDLEDEDDGPLCGIFDVCVYLVQDPRDILEEHDILSFPAPSDDGSLTEETYSRILKFNNILLEFEDDSVSNVFIACYLLRNILCGKAVTLGCPPLFRVPLPRMTNMKALSCLRCKSFTVEPGWAKNNTKSLKALITSSKPLETLLPAYNKIIKIMNQAGLLPTSSSRHMTTVHDLEQALYIHDEMTFKEVGRKLLSASLTAHTENYIEVLRNAEADVKKGKQVIARTNRDIAQTLTRIDEAGKKQREFTTSILAELVVR